MEELGPGREVPLLRGARVLVVEDDAILLIELETVLREAGAEIVAACRTVDEALVAAEKDDLKAAILDVRIGRETIAPVARHLAARGTPFLFYTGQVNSDPGLAEWPGCKVISKPAQAKAIVSAMAELIGDRPAEAKSAIVSASPAPKDTKAPGQMQGTRRCRSTRSI